MAEKTRTLLFAVIMPDDGIDPDDVDPEQVADELVEIINEARQRNAASRPGYAVENNGAES